MMKYILLFFALVLAISCKQKNTTQSPIEAFNSTNEITPNWLIGSWERLGGKEGKKTYEYWNQNEAGEFIGMGCTLEGVDTIWKEDILLSKHSDEWQFNVTGLGDTIATSFLITAFEENRFVGENELNEFPKKIEYTFDGKNINAVISGGGPTIPFNFKKMD